MMDVPFLDNFEVGIAIETSHPTFRDLVPGDWIYSQSDEFAPFGNDDGFDSFRQLSEWVRSGGDAINLGVAAAEYTETLGYDDQMQSYIAQAHVAAACGQLKIAGYITPGMLDIGRLGIEHLKADNANARLTNPDWQHADDQLNKLQAIEAMLAAAPKASIHITTSRGESLADPPVGTLPDLLGKIEGLGGGDFLIANRLADLSGQTFCQTILCAKQAAATACNCYTSHSGPVWTIERREGAADAHFAAMVSDLSSAATLIETWMAGEHKQVASLVDWDRLDFA